MKSIIGDYKIPKGRVAIFAVVIAFVCPTTGQAKSLRVDRRDTNDTAMDESLRFDFLCTCGQQRDGFFPLWEDEKWGEVQAQRRKAAKRDRTRV